MDAAELYDEDILLWSERQADLLRRVAAKAPGNEEAPDWDNIIEEIEAVGRSEFNAVLSLLIQVMLHELKVAAWPQAPYVGHWQKEVRAFRRQLNRQYTASMRQRIDLADLYADAVDRLPFDIDGQPPLPVPADCTFSLDELLKRP